MNTPDALDLHLYGTHVAQVRRDEKSRVPGRIVWEWTDEATSRWGLGSRVVSHALPIGEDAGGLNARATAFIDGLLPEGDLRIRRALGLGLDPDDTYALLSRCGADTAGALTVSAAGDDPPAPGTTPGAALSTADIAALLEEAGAGAFREELTSISLAGMIPKIGVVRDAERRWRLPGSGQPSTWIIKRGHPRDAVATDIIDTEALCLDLGRRCGVTTVDAVILDLGEARAIAVQRFDRLPEGGRLHQEDLAQAIGLATADLTRKFQYGRRLPSWGHAAQVVTAGGGAISPLARLVAFSFVVGNTDHHAKNTAFLRHPDGAVQLAPAYDVAVHLHHSGTHRFALDLAAHREADATTIDHVVREITTWGVTPEQAQHACLDLLTDLRTALDSVDQNQHPGVTRPVWTLLDARITDASRRLGER